jgi:hypothetical protein
LGKNSGARTQFIALCNNLLEVSQIACFPTGEKAYVGTNGEFNNFEA